MPDESTTGDGQQTPEAEGQTKTGEQTTETGQQSGQEQKTFDEAYVKQLRTEAAENRKRAAAAEAKLKELADKDLSDTERLTKAAKEAEEKLTATEQRARTRIARAEVLAAAAQANCVDPDAAYKLIADQIEFDDEGEPKDVAKLVAQLVKDKPYLLKPAGANGGGTANPPGSRGGDTRLAGTKAIPGWSDVFKR